MTYVPLRVHGWHSLLTGVDPPERLCERAAELGLEALALTDVDGTTGLTDFLRAAARTGVRPIVGAELSDAGRRPGRVIALVQNETGYRNLCKLVSARHLGDDPGEREAALDGPESFELTDAVRRFQDGLFLLVDHPRLVYALAEAVPRERLGVALSPVALKKRPRQPRGERVTAGRVAAVPAHTGPKVPPPAQAAAAEDLLESARVFGLATFAVPDVHWVDAEGLEHHRTRTAIKYNALRCDLAAGWMAEPPAHLFTPRELARTFRDLPDVAGPFSRGSGAWPGALVRTVEVARGCAYVPPLGGVIFPELELEEGETPYSRLCALAFDGVRKRYTPLKPEVVRRLDYELCAIDALGYASYFLLVKRIADFAQAEGIPHVGRGSAADSLVAYCLELTDADPMRYKLPFERFLNPARQDRPDIDLDFCWRRRDEVLERVGSAFGCERTAMIATLNRFGLRAAFREAALAEGLPPVEVNRWSRRLPWIVSNAGSTESGLDEPHELPTPQDPTFSATFPAPPGPPGGWGLGMDDEGGGPPGMDDEGGGPPGTDHRGGGPPGTDHRGGNGPPRPALPPGLGTNPIALALRATPECADFPFTTPPYPLVLRVAAALLDAPRHLGLHPGGVVVAPGPITDLVACQRATKGVLMTQLDKDGVEAIGLVKMDLLGNRALTILDDCSKLLGRELELATVPEDDRRTAEMLARGETLGCFQIESPGMRNLLKQTAARNMDDVIQAVALIRPGPASSGMKDAYVRRFRGLEEPRPPHPRLTELLWDTHGVMLYQEDVMQAVVLMAGLELSQADELRRALAKRRGPELERLRELYFRGCAREGVELAGANRVWELVMNFASFGFCKAHAVTYGRIAYHTAYLKAHWPAAYLTAFLNSETGYYATRVYIEEARRLGVLILPPDVNRSGKGFELERSEAEPGIRVGLERVKGLSAATLASILEQREANGLFLSLPDFLRRSGARVDETEHLIQSGAFDAFDRTRPEMLLRLHLLVAPERRAPRARAGEAPLDANRLAACRLSPDETARSNQQMPTGGWSRGSIGVGGLTLGPGESASLFAAPETPTLALPSLPEVDRATRGRLELELLGLNVTSHPTELFPCSLESHGTSPPRIPCRDLDRHRGLRVSLCGWLAASRRVRTKDSRWMRFLTLEDASGIAEAVLFANVYERDGHRLVHRGPFLISGRVEDQMGACTLHADRIW